MRGLRVGECHEAGISIGQRYEEGGEYKCNIEWGLKVVEVHLMKHMKEAEKSQKMGGRREVAYYGVSRHQCHYRSRLESSIKVF
jgi:hypothetical protein